MSAAVRPPGGIARIGVVVPARDEQELLPRCLDAIRDAATRLGERHDIDVSIVVVLDRCVDASAEVVAAYDDMTAIAVQFGNVGLARATGCAEVLRRHVDGDPSTLWLASTDADSRVPVDWLTRQVELADRGAEVVLGTVSVDDWTGHPAHVAQRWAATYDTGDGHHHVHGANVGCRADAYLAARGFPGLSCAEDVGLVTALGDRVIMRVGDIAVSTSARVRARAVGGFATFLAELA
jgi:glycosyltransferase involved in cell wall biosynthesis